MRKVTFGAACSLDLYIAGPNNDAEWIRWGDSVTTEITNYWAKVDTVVFGRKTYEVAKAQSPGGSVYPGIANYICSRTLPSGPLGNAVVIPDAVALVKDLQKKPGKEICVMGGGVLANSLLEAGMIDEIGLNIHPVLLGGGVPLFHQMKRLVELELVENKTLKNGCVLLTYRRAG